MKSTYTRAKSSSSATKAHSRELQSAWLAAEGFSLGEAADAESALSAIGLRPIAAVVVDNDAIASVPPAPVASVPLTHVHKPDNIPRRRQELLEISKCQDHGAGVDVR